MVTTNFEGASAERPFAHPPTEQEVLAVAGSVLLPGILMVPQHPAGIVLCTTSQGGASHRDSPSRILTSALCGAGLAVLHVDVVTADEARDDVRSDSIRNDLPMVMQRIEGATDWLAFHPRAQHLPVGYLGFGATATEAMLEAAVARADSVRALVLVDGRPDIVADAVARVRAPVLAIIDEEEAPLASELAASLAGAAGLVELVRIKGESRTGAGGSGGTSVPDRVVELAKEWFQRHLPGRVLLAAREG